MNVYEVCAGTIMSVGYDGDDIDITPGTTGNLRRLIATYSRGSARVLMINWIDGEWGWELEFITPMSIRKVGKRDDLPTSGVLDGNDWQSADYLYSLDYQIAEHMRSQLQDAVDDRENR